MHLHLNILELHEHFMIMIMFPTIAVQRTIITSSTYGIWSCEHGILCWINDYHDGSYNEPCLNRTYLGPTLAFGTNIRFIQVKLMYVTCLFVFQFRQYSLYLFKWCDLWSDHFMEYLFHKWSRICSTCRRHIPVLSSFMTYHRVCN